MRFPGEDYLLYVQNPNMARYGKKYHKQVVFRFLYTEDFVLNKKRDDEVVAASGIFGKNPWLLAFEDGNLMEEHTRVSIRYVPIWHLFGESESLERMAQNCDTVYVKIPKGTSSPTDEVKSGALALWTMSRRYPGVNFIPFGSFNRKIHLELGLPGGSVSAIFHGGNSGNGLIYSKVRLPNGFTEEFATKRFDDESVANNVNRIKKTLAKYGEVSSYGKTTLMEFAIESVKLMPIYFKEFYSGVHEQVPEFVPSEMSRAERIKHKRSPNLIYFVNMAKTGRGSPQWTLPGDKHLCNSCSVQYACRLFERGSVCGLPGSDEQRISSFFGTRDSEKVIDGIGAILKFNVKRFENLAAIEDEENERKKNEGKTGYYDPEVSKLGSQIMKDAERYAKLIDPALTRPQVAVQVNTGEAARQAVESHRTFTNKELAVAARELEAKGTPRDEITPELVEKFLVNEGQEIIEGEIVNGVKNDF